MWVISTYRYDCKINLETGFLVAYEKEEDAKTKALELVNEQPCKMVYEHNDNVHKWKCGHDYIQIKCECGYNNEDEIWIVHPACEEGLEWDAEEIFETKELALIYTRCNLAREFKLSIIREKYTNVDETSDPSVYYYTEEDFGDYVRWELLNQCNWRATRVKFIRHDVT